MIYAIAPSPLTDATHLGRHRRRPDLAHAATTARTGRTSRRAALTPWSKVGIIDASHFDPDTAYAAIDRHRLDDQQAVHLPHARRRRAAGSRSPTACRTAAHSVNVVREDPVRRGLLYAGTETRRLRLVRRRRPLAAAADGPAGDLGARHRRPRRRPRDRHARPRLLGAWTTSSPLRALAAHPRTRPAPVSDRRRPSGSTSRASPARRCRRTSRSRRTRRLAR